MRLVTPFKAKLEDSYVWIRKGVDQKWVRFWYVGDEKKINIVSQSFGGYLNGHYARYGMKGHNGIDYAIPNGTCIYAVADGEITEAVGAGSGYGSYIRQKFQQDNKNYTFIYGHLEKPLVQAGQQVRAHDLIGISDNTGDSTGAHLHGGLREHDKSWAVKNYNNGYLGYIDHAPYMFETLIYDSSDLKDLYEYAKEKGIRYYGFGGKRRFKEAMKILGIEGHTRGQYYNWRLKH